MLQMHVLLIKNAILRTASALEHHALSLNVMLLALAGRYGMTAHLLVIIPVNILLLRPVLQVVHLVVTVPEALLLMKFLNNV